jgi:hypothetical protein
MTSRYRLSLAILATCLTATPLLAQDSGGQDHAELPRYPGAVIDEYRVPSLDNVVMPTGPIANEDGTANRQLLEGRVTHIDYRVKPATAPLQIERYYTDLLGKAGYKVAYSCIGPACGNVMGALILNSGKVAPSGLADGLFNDRIRVVIARRDKNWVLLHIAEGPDRSQIFETVVENASPA